MKQISTLIFAFIILATQHIFAVPVYHNPINHTLPDGSQITIQMRGGKSLNWAETLDGFTLLLNSDGFFEYATLNEIGDLIPSGVRVNDVSGRTRAEQDFLRNIPRGLRFSDAQIETKRELRGVRDEFLRRRAEEGPRRVSGNVRIPVILVGFADRPFIKTRDDFYMLFNQLNTGSVHDYFYDVSHGQLSLQAEIFGPFILPNPIAFYDDECPHGNPNGPRIMAGQAVDSAYHSGADFSTFHHTIVGGVPTLSAVHIIFAGHCQSMNPNALRCQAIWSHAWVLDVARTFNGIRIWYYSCSAELRGASGQNMETIGTIAHELGHSLFGWPDSYSVNLGPGTGTGGCVDFGTWCLMATGVRNGNPIGSVPARPSAWFLVDAGWADEITLTEPQSVIIPNPAQTGRVYRINTTTPGEYFLLENRQQIGWDAHIPSSGLLISHVDRTPAALPFWDANAILSFCNRRRLYIKQAGCAAANGCGGNRANDVWGRTGAREFTDNSTPNARSWAGENTEKPVTEITLNTVDRTISFAFMGGSPPPVVEPATVPYFEGFEGSGTAIGGPLPYGWTQYSQFPGVPLNVWFPTSGVAVEGIQFFPRTGFRQMIRTWGSTGDFVWAFSRPILLSAGTTYTVSFWYLAPGYADDYDELFDNFKVQIGPSRELFGTGMHAQMVGATTLLEVYYQRVESWTHVSLEFTPTVSGPHYLGFHCMTEFREGLIVAIDDISITETDTNAPAPIFEITLSQTEMHTFDTLVFGYDASDLTPLLVTITNTGNQPTGELQISLLNRIPPAPPTDFELSKTFVSTIAVGEYSTFTVVPIVGRDIGTHTETITVFGNNGISENFDVRFTVIEDTTPTNIANIVNVAPLQVFPNPVTDYLQLTTYNLQIGDIIELFDMSGRRVFSRTICQLSIVNCHFSIDISHLPNGTYIVRIGHRSTIIVKQ